MLVSLKSFRVGKILLVCLENGRSVDNWIKRSPFLEEDVDKLI